MFKRQPFWWGVSVAALPGVSSLPALAYAGIAVVNSVWQLFLRHDCPEPTVLFGGLVYGVIVGPLLQCLVIGTVASTTWYLGIRRFSLFSRPTSRWVKLAFWVGLEALYLASFVWVLLTMAAYALTALLAVLIHPTLV